MDDARLNRLVTDADICPASLPSRCANADYVGVTNMRAARPQRSRGRQHLATRARPRGHAPLPGALWWRQLPETSGRVSGGNHG